jgi:iron(III) transport system substrate-binding protein
MVNLTPPKGSGNVQGDPWRDATEIRMNAVVTNSRWLRRSAVVIIVASMLQGCAEPVPPRVVVSTNVEREVALPIFAAFTKSTGINVEATYEGEPVQPAASAPKTVPGARLGNDLFWNETIFETLRLEREGRLRPFTPPAENDFPATARSPQSNWYAIATDARVLVINTRQIAEARLPKSIEDLTDPQWYERTAIARPTAGASATHAACIFQVWGDAKAQEFFLAVKRNARILASDREVAHAVATGSLAFGLTSASDAIVELASDAPIAIVYPDQEEDQLGTLFIPSTVALLKESPNKEPAEKLLDFLLSAEVAQKLANVPAALQPLRTGISGSKELKAPAEIRAMSADFPAAAKQWETTAKFLDAEFGP